MDKVKVRMTRTEKGSEEGFRLDTFNEGETYNMDPWLANVFINQMECAVKVDGLDEPELPEEKPADVPKEAPVDVPKEGTDVPDIETPADNEKVETSYDDKPAKARPGDIMTKAGKPFGTMNTALSARTKRKLSDTVVVAVEGGYIIRPN